ncbi:M23 family metallopeptidase [Geobacter benzoatilyticus]|uniref:M23 family metallopeptidase n=1 Tax=Geobacter benzoatilyticus TaxID=2815309 RepID=A0ABX7Q1A7_9BACT|nr:M23 family metallopeptidase [Geobacter benzoatilyticus]QSV44873.1 M23 family metallopeptidase [Geobacter benzoatilyticus]
MKIKALILAAITLAFPREGVADIYRYVDDEGVICFTDAPAKSGTTLVIKERRGKRGITAHKSSIANEGKAAASQASSRALPVQGRISSLVGLRHDPINGTLREHHGIDIAVAEGTEVRPVGPGRVIFSGSRGGYGNMVMIEHGDGTMTLYAHNSVNLATEGSDVDGTSPIALSGSTGRSTGPHLHFEAWRGDTNITSSYLAAGAAAGNAAGRKPADVIRRIVQADGTLYFGNIH